MITTTHRIASTYFDVLMEFKIGIAIANSASIERPSLLKSGLETTRLSVGFPFM